MLDATGGTGESHVTYLFDGGGEKLYMRKFDDRGAYCRFVHRVLRSMCWAATVERHDQRR